MVAYFDDFGSNLYEAFEEGAEQDWIDLFIVSLVEEMENLNFHEKLEDIVGGLSKMRDCINTILLFIKEKENNNKGETENVAWYQDEAKTDFNTGII